MTTLSALAFAVFGVVMLGFGVYLGVRFASANRWHHDTIARFSRDQDIDDSADMATDEDRP